MPVALSEHPTTSGFFLGNFWDIRDRDRALTSDDGGADDESIRDSSRRFRIVQPAGVGARHHHRDPRPPALPRRLIVDDVVGPQFYSRVHREEEAVNMRRHSVAAVVLLLSLPALAFIGDSAEHAPPSTGTFAYNSFIPAPGSSYVDPIFNETVRRLTGDGTHDDLYARNMWWNASGTRLLHRSQAGGSDRWRVIDVATGTVTHDNIPFGSIASDGGFDPVDPDVLYSLIEDNGSGRGELRKITLGPAGTWTPEVYFTAPAPIHELGGTINWLDASGRYMVVRYGPEPSVYV